MSDTLRHDGPVCPPVTRGRRSSDPTSARRSRREGVIGVGTTHRYTLPIDDGADPELVAAELMGAGATGLWEREHGGQTELVAWFTERTDPVPSGGRWEVEPARDWLATWREGLEPVTVGRVRIVPSWLAEHETVRSRPAPPATIVLDPGMAFGTGHHPTTRLCLRELQRSDPRGASVLDVGTGSGILAIAATVLGATRVVAVDTDPDAVAVARDNARTNAAAVDVRHGSVGASGGGPFDLVLANLTTDTLVALADRLVAAARRTLVVSGVGLPRVDEVREALWAAGVGPTEVTTEGEWAAVRAVPSRPTGPTGVHP